jgi:hypothetical protein
MFITFAYSRLGGPLKGLFVLAAMFGSHLLSASSGCSLTVGARGRLLDRGGGTIVWNCTSSKCPVEILDGEPGPVLRGGGAKFEGAPGGATYDEFTAGGGIGGIMLC